MFFMSERQKELTVRPAKPIFSPKTGEKIGEQRRVFANVDRGYIPSWAIEIAEKTFAMGGKPPSVPTHRWLSSYDSDAAQRLHGWTSEERRLIEEKLLSKGDVLHIEPPLVEAPYAMYDKHRELHGQRKLPHVLNDIRATYELAGFDVGEAVAYERQNLNDPEVIGMLESLVPVPAEPEPLIAA